MEIKAKNPKLHIFETCNVNDTLNIRDRKKYYKEKERKR